MGIACSSPAQRELLERVVREEPLREDTLAAQLPQWRPAATALLKRGWIQSEAVATQLQSDPAGISGPAPSAPAPTLTPEQALAVTRIGAALPGFATFVLHGLTGSGKTEVYLQVIQQALATTPRRWAWCRKSA